MFVPTKECFCNMSPTDFEKYSLYLLKQQTQGLENVKIEHNVIVEKVTVVIRLMVLLALM